MDISRGRHLRKKNNAHPVVVLPAQERIMPRTSKDRIEGEGRFRAGIHNMPIFPFPLCNDRDAEI